MYLFNSDEYSKQNMVFMRVEWLIVIKMSSFRLKFTDRKSKTISVRNHSSRPLTTFHLQCSNTMQHNEILTSLPSRLSCIIMQDWLNLKSVVALDSAYCCKAHRKKFTDLVQSDEYFVQDDVTIDGQSKFFCALSGWGEKLRSLVVNGILSPDLEQLVVAHCHNLTHVRFHGHFSCKQSICDLLSNKIVHLNLSDAYLAHFELELIPRLCPNLRTLGLACTHLTTKHLTVLTKSCPNIAHLDISKNDYLTDSGILSVVKALKSLQGLNIVGCATLTDASLVHIYSHCANTLHTLQMNCHELNWFQELSFSISAINALLEFCMKLRVFQTSGPGTVFPIHISPAGITKLTTLMLINTVYVEEIDAARESYANLRTIVANVFYPIDNLRDLVKRYVNLQEVRLITRSQCNVAIDKVVVYARQAQLILQMYRPDLVVKWIHASGNEYLEQDVMNM